MAVKAQNAANVLSAYSNEQAVAPTTSNPVINPSFEVSSSSWTFNSYASIDNTFAADGSYAANLAVDSASAHCGTISQNVTLAPGTYNLRFYVEDPSTTSHVNYLTVSAGGSVIASVTPQNYYFTPYTVTFVTSGGSVPIQFSAQTNGAAGSIRVDSVSIAPTILKNGSFEVNTLPTPATSITDPTNISNWSFTGNAGVRGEGLYVNSQVGTDGVQTAFLQNAYGTANPNGLMYQTVFLGTGTYSLSFDASDDPAHDVLNSITAEFAPSSVPTSLTTIATVTPPSSVATLLWAHYSMQFSITSSGSYRISFAAGGSGGDTQTKISFVDNVSLAQIPSNDPPPAPILTSATAANGQVMLNWSGAPGANGYTIFYGTSPTSISTQLDVSNAITQNSYYDHRGNVIESIGPTGLVTKTQYDGVGQATATFTTDGGVVNFPSTAATWSAAGSIANDLVLTQTQYIYDNDGNVIETIKKDRFDTDGNASGDTGTLGTHSTAPYARVSYTASYFDAGDRDILDVNVGTNGGSAWVRPASSTDSSLTRSPIIMMTGYHYNDAGYQDQVTDPRGIVTQTSYDALGRTTMTIVGYTDGTATASSNQKTVYDFDGDNHIVDMVAVLPGGAFQSTHYAYGATISGGSQIDSNDLLSQIQYPDVSSGSPSPDLENDISYTYDAVGDTQTMTDRNGDVHVYNYDLLGRVTQDAVGPFGGTVDSTVVALQYSYNSQGLAYQETAVKTGGVIQNQVRNVYNGLGQLTGQYQAVSGTNGITVGTTPEVLYGYSSVGSGSLPASMTYPNGRILHYGYGTNAASTISNPLDAAIGRIDFLADDNGSGGLGQDLEEYTYLGLSTIVSQNRPQPHVKLSLSQQTGDTLSSGDSADPYVGLDRFGRVIDQNWFKTTGSYTYARMVDRFQYGYDANGNVLYKDNLKNGDFGELYHTNSTTSGDNNSAYDALGRLKSFTRGALSSSGNNGTAGPGSLDMIATGDVNTAIAGYNQSWSLDALGNQVNSTNDTSSTTNTFNSQNQLTTNATTAGTHPLTYDGAGNVLTDENGTTFTYDAWNRMTTATPATGGHEEFFTYNALGEKLTTLDMIKPSIPLSMIVDDGNIQRSSVGSLTLVFNQSVSLTSSLITLTDSSSNSYSLFIYNPEHDHKTWVVEFTSGTVNGSLPDGQYTLYVPASAVSGETISNTSFYFHCLFGDFQGTGTHTMVDGNAWNALFGADRPNNYMADYNGDGTVDFSDEIAYGNDHNGPYTDPTGGGLIIGNSASEAVSWDPGAPSKWVPRQLYYSSQSQVIEEDAQAPSNTPTMQVQNQYVWGLAYVNELVLRDDNTGAYNAGNYGKSGSGLDERLYAQQDANFNVTSLVDVSGNVVQRFIYDPYGNVTVLDSGWGVSLELFSWTVMYQGGMWDPTIKQYFFNIGGSGRYYDPQTGRWGQQDRGGYADGINTYQFAESNPIDQIDPQGTSTAKQFVRNAVQNEKWNHWRFMYYHYAGLGTFFTSELAALDNNRVVVKSFRAGAIPGHAGAQAVTFNSNPIVMDITPAAAQIDLNRGARISNM